MLAAPMGRARIFLASCIKGIYAALFHQMALSQEDEANARAQPSSSV